MTRIDILEEHLHELDFLWAQRERSVVSPEWTLLTLGRLEDRAEAHLDGLRLGGAPSAELARPMLGLGEAGSAAAATFVLMAFERPDLEQQVLQALRAAPAGSRDGIRIGLRHSEVTRIAAELSEIAASGEPGVRAAALDVVAFHRLPTPRGIATLLADPDPEVRRLACEAAGRLGGPWSYDVLREALESDSHALRISALRASARMGLIGLDESCRQAATRPQNPVPEALEFLGVLGDPKDLGVLQNSTARPGLAEAALSGLGKLGSVAAIPAILDALTDDALKPAAGRAFARITGATEVASAEADPNEARAFWDEAKGRLPAEGRWQSGHDLAKQPFGEAFDTLPLETRLDVFLGARARDPRQTPDRELEQKAVLQRART
jgi:uncharacterized protein (TIGR02270 family)